MPTSSQIISVTPRASTCSTADTASRSPHLRPHLRRDSAHICAGTAHRILLADRRPVDRVGVELDEDELRKAQNNRPKSGQHAAAARGVRHTRPWGMPRQRARARNTREPTRAPRRRRPMSTRRMPSPTCCTMSYCAATLTFRRVALLHHACLLAPSRTRPICCRRSAHEPARDTPNAPLFPRSFSSCFPM